jgi:hypothetical protein
LMPNQHRFCHYATEPARLPQSDHYDNQKNHQYKEVAHYWQ